MGARIIQKIWGEEKNGHETIIECAVFPRSNTFGILMLSAEMAREGKEKPIAKISTNTKI